MEGSENNGGMDLNRFAEKVLVIVVAFAIIAVGTYIVLRHRGIDWKWQYQNPNQNQNQSQNGQSV